MSIGNLELRERVCNALHFHIAACGDVHGAPQHIRDLAENGGHFFRGLKIKLIRCKLHAVRIAHGLAGLNAQQHFLCVRVIMMQIVAVVRCHQRNACFLRKPYQMRIYLLLDFQSLVLNLQEKILLAENIAQAVSILARLIVFFVYYRLGHRALEASRQRNEPAAMLLQEVVINSRFIVKAFQES